MSSRLGFRPDEFDEERYVDVDRRGFRRVPPVYDYYDGGTPPMTFSGKATKYPNFTDLSRSGEPKVEKADQEKTRQQPPPLSAEFAENTTLQGIAYIHRSKKWYRAIFWVIIFLAAVAATVYQTYTVVHKYYSYGTTTSVGMGYDKLPFPSVDICNINPIRLSASSDFSDELADFLATIVPDNSYDKQRSAPTTTSPPDGDNKRVKTSDEGVFDPENTPDVDQVSPTPRPAPHNGFETLPEDNLSTWKYRILRDNKTNSRASDIKNNNGEDEYNKNSNNKTIRHQQQQHRT
ncbi:hypothetical protein LSH36_26g10035 [Paralvinella palmiformis]|uniref:Uncharacterized protein n=1 Tax=Paralvinella palmiformis TaxID=53620 RepID=A0AAD9NF01_9ANNE|nr:hypothetical protein LSH36_26g10035 [Paralvinella palmiformis]